MPGTIPLKLPMTFEFNIKVAELQADYARVFEFWRTAADTIMLHFRKGTKAGTYYFQFRVGHGNSAGRPVDLFKDELVVGDWYHVVFSFAANSDVTSYLNGVSKTASQSFSYVGGANDPYPAITTGTWINLVDGARANMYLFRSAVASDPKPRGVYLGGFRIWKSVLSQTDVSTLYNGVNEVAGDLLVYYKFDQAGPAPYNRPSRFDDYSGNGYNTTLIDGDVQSRQFSALPPLSRDSGTNCELIL
eukprot:tig00020902_g15062.t1